MYWLSITGVTHVVLESYYVLTPKFYTVDYPMYLAEVCKFLTHIFKHLLLYTFCYEHMYYDRKY